MSTPIDIRADWMMKGDLPQVLAIERECFPFPWDEHDFLDALRERHTYGWVARNEFGRVIGYMIYSTSRTRFQLLSIAVDRICQRRRVGTQLLSQVKRRLSDIRPKVRAIVLDSNLSAQLFLRASGFKAVRVDRDTHEIDGLTRDSYVMTFMRQPVYADAACDVSAAER